MALKFMFHSSLLERKALGIELILRLEVGLEKCNILEQTDEPTT